MAIKYGVDRAKKYAYFCDSEGDNIVDFQFNPANLPLSEGQEYNDKVTTGSYEPDVLWVSAKTQRFNIDMFIDRTYESAGGNSVNDSFVPNKNPFQGLTNLAFGTVEASATFNNGNRIVTGLRNAFRKENKEDALEARFVKSDYRAGNNVNSGDFDANVGVLGELKKLLFYVGPKDVNSIPRADVSNDFLTINANTKVIQYSGARKYFTPPPMVQFFYGNIWREGFIENIEYNLSVPNRDLVPQRLEATLQFLVVRGGFLEAPQLSPVSTKSLDGSRPQFI